METGRNYNYIKENLETVRAGLLAVAEEAGRKSPPVLIAAVKYADEAEIATLLSSGVTDVGENRVQQLTERAPLYEASGARVHFIGTLQKNKVKYLIGHTALIHSVDSTELAAEIEKRAGAKGLTVDILLEINSACEAGKSGVPAEEAAALFASVSAFTHLRVRGFMTMGPAGADSETYRRCFQKPAKWGFLSFGRRGAPNGRFSLWGCPKAIGRPCWKARISCGSAGRFSSAIRVTRCPALNSNQISQNKK